MWKVVETDRNAYWGNGDRIHSVATLSDRYKRAQIAIDEHCYVLLLKECGSYNPTSWWFEEAVIAMQQLPTPREYELKEAK